MTMTSGAPSSNASRLNGRNANLAELAHGFAVRLRVRADTADQGERCFFSVGKPASHADAATNSVMRANWNRYDFEDSRRHGKFACGWVATPMCSMSFPPSRRECISERIRAYAAFTTSQRLAAGRSLLQRQSSRWHLCSKRNHRQVLASPVWGSAVGKHVITAKSVVISMVTGSPGRIRTSDQPVNSRLLYH